MPSLRRRMLEDMQLRHLSPQTQITYVQQVARFARHFRRSPADLGPEAIRAYQLYLTTERGRAVESVMVAVAALMVWSTSRGTSTRFVRGSNAGIDRSTTSPAPASRQPHAAPSIPPRQDPGRYRSGVGQQAIARRIQAAQQARQLGTVVIAADTSNVDTVLVAGRIVKQHEQLMRVDLGSTTGATFT